MRASTTQREQELGEELMGALERFLLLQIIDDRWREHLYDMDYLREGIHLRGFAQIDPLVAYKNEALHALRRPDEHDLGRLRADDLQRRGRGRGRERRRSRAGRAARRPAARRAPARVSYSGGVSDGVRRRRAAPRRPRRRRRAGRAGAPTPARTSGRRVVEQRVVDDEQPGRAQRPVLVRLGQEVQEVPRRLAGASAPVPLATPRACPRPDIAEPTPQRLAAIRDQLKLLADYL